MGYNTINGTIGNIRGKHDSINSIASGALIGLLFKSAGIYFSQIVGLL
jgi:import inner membrane translocase subunit TIM23